MIALTWTTIAHASAAASMWVTPTQAATTTMTGGVVGIRPHGYGHASPVLDKRYPSERFAMVSKLFALASEPRTR